MSAQSQPLISYGSRLSMLAAEHPQQDALRFVPQHGPMQRITWAQLEAASNQLARLLQSRGVAGGSLVVAALPNSPAHFYAAFATWKLGATLLPLNAALPAAERDRLLEAANPALVIAAWPDLRWPGLHPADFGAAERFASDPLPDCLPDPGIAIGSGGSTGRPKIILRNGPLAHVPGQLTTYPALGGVVGLRPGQTQLVVGPLYHSGPFSWAHEGLFEGHTLVVMERWDTARVIDLIERERVNFMFMVPTMMSRIAKHPAVRARDFSSVESLFHAGGPCPPWIKQAWFDLIGAARVFEGFGSSESVGVAVIRGDEWLAHPGSVGRPLCTDVQILDAQGQPLPPGEVGEIYMRWQHRPNPGFRYLGTPAPPTTPDGYTSVGDMGWLDAEGYLYSADRRVDLIITGGANVYPAEVEAALIEHPAVSDVVVIGLPDDEWGRRVHAIIQPASPGAPPTPAELSAHCRARLAAYKVPKSYEFLEALPRSTAGKIRRVALVEERAGWQEGHGWERSENGELSRGDL